jgi:hypothetical protein
MTDGAQCEIGHKITANTVMYPGSGPSGVEVKPLRPASLCIYQWSFGLQDAPRVAWREEEEALSSLLYARDYKWPERVTVKAQGPFI